MYPEGAGDPHQRGKPDITRSGLDALEGGSGDVGG